MSSTEFELHDTVNLRNNFALGNICVCLLMKVLCLNIDCVDSE